MVVVLALLRWVALGVEAPSCLDGLTVLAALAAAAG
jgi:hypothetical protein